MKVALGARAETPAIPSFIEIRYCAFVVRLVLVPLSVGAGGACAAGATGVLLRIERPNAHTAVPRHSFAASGAVSANGCGFCLELHVYGGRCVTVA